jgi:hypothetical protein
MRIVPVGKDMKQISVKILFLQFVVHRCSAICFSASVVAIAKSSRVFAVRPTASFVLVLASSLVIVVVLSTTVVVVVSRHWLEEVSVVNSKRKTMQHSAPLWPREHGEKQGCAPADSRARRLPFRLSLVRRHTFSKKTCVVHHQVDFLEEAN